MTFVLTLVDVKLLKLLTVLVCKQKPKRYEGRIIYMTDLSKLVGVPMVYILKNLCNFPLFIAIKLASNAFAPCLVSYMGESIA